MKTYFLIIATLVLNSLYSQKEYTILVPTEHYKNIPPPGKAPNIKTLMEQIGHYANLYASINCLEKMNPLIEAAMKKEMSNIKEGTSYILTVDYTTCEFLSLLPDKGTGGIFPPTATVYHITLYQKIERDPVIKKDPADAGKKPLLATYTDAHGNWIAMGPYMTSDPYPTEKQAIGSLFYPDNAIQFICERGNYKIYSLNEPMKYDGRDIRYALKQLGIDNIPDN